MTQTIRALTLDLDDTLWPIWPAIERAEAVLHAWLAAHAPATARRYGIAALRELRDAVGRSRGDWAHDLSALRRESLRLALADAGDDPALAEPAFECFFAERQKVDLFDDVLPALERLASRYPLLALSNGNADIARIGLARYFRGSLSAREFGVGKPDPRIFHAACGRLGQPGASVLHVGDDPLLDIAAAHAAGQPSAWVKRPGALHEKPAQATHAVENLLQLADLLGA